MRIVVALGGKTLRATSAGVEFSAANARIGEQLRELAHRHTVIFTHGAVPGLGASGALDSAAAAAQGQIGYWLVNELSAARPAKRAVAVTTRVVVNQEELDLAAPGVPTVAPERIMERSAIADLSSEGRTVVCCGGGGIAVVRDAQGRARGVPAVVDNDRTSELLARELHADALVFLTSVDGVYADFGTSDQARLRHATTTELRAMNLPAASMGTKSDAACSFVSATGRPASIGSLDDCLAVASGKAGTLVRHSDARAAEHERRLQDAWSMLS